MGRRSKIGGWHRMKPDAIIYTVAGMCFGVILGWVMGTQQPGRPGAVTQVAAGAGQGASAPASTANQRQAPPLDEAKVRALTTILEGDPKNASAAVQLANVYFDAEQFDDAIGWYRKALDVDPNNPDASTDLGVSYYYTNRTDEALAQFEKSLAIDAKHTKTMLNKGIVLAFGKQDIKGASVEWQRVVELAPDSPEGAAAKRALEGVAAAHAQGAAPPANN
jgi:tetratricopeptide (TPR) repeat protein